MIRGFRLGAWGGPRRIDLLDHGGDLTVEAFAVLFFSRWRGGCW
jgi:hypothetical protein